ncbi:hypothetical protein HDU98_003056 [Podochytrium sp. JEL0797]|nr:hypothetical protein HDU98_003056 [Podochytrium sp. JEL0797]
MFAMWFGDKERLTANTVMSLALYAGTALAMGLGPSIVGSDPNNISKLNLVTFLIVASTGLSAFFVYNQPRLPPSKSAVQESLPFMEGMKRLIQNWQFIIMFFVFGIVAGSLDTHFTLISDYITPYGYSESDAGTLGIVTIAVGTATSVVLGFILDRTKQHRASVKVLAVVTFLGTVGFYFGAKSTEQRTLLFVSAAALGVGAFPLAPIALELGVECTHPVAEGSSAGMLQTSGQIFGIIVLVVSNALRGADGTLGDALLWRIAIVAVVVVIAPLYTARSRRMALERKNL